MAERREYPQGVPSWVDLATSDAEAAREFYRGLFGWDYDIIPDPQYGGYANCLLRGRRVAGLGPRTDEGQPVAWTTYLAVDDAEKAAEAVREHGGQVLMGPMAIGEEGKFAMAADPTGAVFGMWQAGRHFGAELVNEPGSLSWNELVTADLDRATRFYSDVLGVSWSDMGGGPPGTIYKVMEVGGRIVAGAMPLSQQPGDAPPHWSVYFAVEDASATADRVRELGGQVFGDVIDTPQGPMAAVSDPQGGMFLVIAVTQPAS